VSEYEFWLEELELGEDILTATEEVLAWGFPREVTNEEWLYARWFMMGPRVIFWIETIPGFPEDVAIHGATAPSVRGHWPVERWFRHVLTISEQMGARRIRSASEGEIPDFMAALGFDEDPVIGQVFDLRQTPKYGRRD